MKIVSLVFGGGVSTLGMDVVAQQITERGNHVFHFDGRVSTVKDADVLLVSLYWFLNIFEYMAFLKKYGIDPKKKKPVIVIGGISAVNTDLLEGLFHYCILGDGEVVINDLLDAVGNGCEPNIPGVVKSGDTSPNEFVHSSVIPAFGYVEDRGNNTTRIEIARGCRYRCPFCQLGHSKPYREQPVEVVSHLLSSSKTKSVALFAPDRSGYSQIRALEDACKKLGKHNTAEDLRLDSLSKVKHVSKLKFGVEGFTEKTRKAFRKVASNQKLIDGMRHIFTEMKKPNGKRHTTATMYMIGDLPGETPERAAEFWDVLAECDKYCKPPFTLFLTLNSFSPKAYTPLERRGIHPFNDWNTFWSNRPRFKNITIAGRGGMLGPSNRIAHLITARGDQRLTKLAFWLATDGSKVFKDNSEQAGKHLCKLIKSQGVDHESIWGELDESCVLPHHRYKLCV